jgi:phenylpropionate dioxygenase-like ring-hydroxylating dioxygenase large terminal subunit
MDSALGTDQRNAARYGDLVRPDGMIHRRLFTDPRIFDEEMVRIFGRSWVFLLHEAEVPAPHDFKTITIGRRPVIVTRSPGGQINALLNRCTHRGSLVCVETQGNANRFQCPYHSWSFASDGQLLGVTFPKGSSPHFDRSAHDLYRFPRVESYRGFVFGCLIPHVEPLIEWLGAAAPIIDWAVDKDRVGPGGVRIAKGTFYTVNGNWKLQSDNNNDSYHAPFLHLSTARMNQQLYGSGKGLDHFKGDESPMYLQDLGNGHKFLDQRPSITSAWERTRPIPGKEVYAEALTVRLGGEAALEHLELVGRTGINLVLYPNLFILGHGMFAVFEPVAVDKTNVRYYTALPNDAPVEVNALRLRFAEDFNTLGVRDDNEAIERVQHALSTIPEMEWVDYSRGLGTNRETFETNGVITGNIMDETGLRGSYKRWQQLMDRDDMPVNTQGCRQ